MSKQPCVQCGRPTHYLGGLPARFVCKLYPLCKPQREAPSASAPPGSAGSGGVSSCDSQRGVPTETSTRDDIRVATAKDSAGAPPCDSPELAAIRQWINDSRAEENRIPFEKADALLRMVDELTATLQRRYAEEILRDQGRSALLLERDELKEKLAVAERLQAALLAAKDMHIAEQRAVEKALTALRAQVSALANQLVLAAERSGVGQ